VISSTEKLGYFPTKKFIVFQQEIALKKIGSKFHGFFLLFEKLLGWQSLENFETLYFYIHPSFEPKNTFQLYSCTFSFRLGNFIHILSRNGKKFREKKEFIYLAKSRDLF